VDETGWRKGGWVWLGRFCVGGCFVTVRAALGFGCRGCRFVVAKSRAISRLRRRSGTYKRTSEMTAQVPSLVPRLYA